MLAPQHRLQNAPDEKQAEHITDDVENRLGAMQKSVSENRPDLELPEVLPAQPEPFEKKGTSPPGQPGKENIQHLLQDEHANRDHQKSGDHTGFPGHRLVAGRLSHVRSVV